MTGAAAGAGGAVLITRPQADAAPLAAILAGHGIASLIEPLLDIVPVAAPALMRDLAGIQAILFTSSNGVRALTAALADPGHLDNALAGIPVLAVGDSTAAAARAAGFRQVESAAGAIPDLVALTVRHCAPAAGPLLHVAGSVVAGDLAGDLAGAGFTVRRVVLYQAATAERLSDAACRAITGGRVAAVLFFSPRTAKTFVRLAAAAGIAAACSGLSALCLSEAVAQAVRTLVWRDVRVAARPDRAALLDLLGLAAEDMSPDGNAEPTKGIA